MPSATPPPRSEDAAPFRLRGTSFNLVVLQMRDPRPEAVVPALERLLKQAPAFLDKAPIILGLDDVTMAAKDIDFAGLVEGLRGHNLFPIGVSGGKPSMQVAAAKVGLAVLPKGAAKREEVALTTMAPTPQPAAEAPDPTEAGPAEPALPIEEPKAAKESKAAKEDGAAEKATAAEEPASTETPPAANGAEAPAGRAAPTMVVTAPVRAGRQIYAGNGADLIVTATVNAGAEVIADGNIHVYGALRGRAIAGAAGDEAARVFALDFDPELVAIAGLYRVREDLDQRLIGESVQIRLEADHMRFEMLGRRR